MWVTTLKLGDELDIGPGMMIVKITGITRRSAFLSCTVGVLSTVSEIQVESGVRINKAIYIKLFETGRSTARLGIRLPEGKKCVRVDETLTKRQNADGKQKHQTTKHPASRPRKSS